MATATSSHTPDNSTDANFRDWGKALSDAMQTLGITKTTDTGQINWATVTHPTASNTVQGYEIRQLTDALQTTAPFYIKIEYGSRSDSANAPGIWLTCGTGTDGAGNLTGNLSTRHQFGSSSNNTTARVMYFSGDTNRFCCDMFDESGYTSFIIFGFERTKDSTGADTSTGLLIFVAASQTGNLNQFRNGMLPSTGTVPAFQTNWRCAQNEDASTQSGGGTIGFSVPIPFVPYPIYPGLNFMCYSSSDTAPYVTIPVTIYGVSHTYLPASTSQNPTSRASSRPMIRYE